MDLLKDISSHEKDDVLTSNQDHFGRSTPAWFNISQWKSGRRHDQRLPSLLIRHQRHSKSESLFFSPSCLNLKQAGKNELEVVIEPHPRYGAQLLKSYKSEFPLSFPYRILTRLPGYSYGWDFAPSLPGQGIIKPVKIVAYDIGMISYVNVNVQKRTDADWDVDVSLEKF